MCDIGDIKLVKLWWASNRWQALGYCEHDNDLVPIESGDDKNFLIELNAYDISQESDLVIALQDSYYSCKVMVDPIGYWNASI